MLCPGKIKYAMVCLATNYGRLCLEYGARTAYQMHLGFYWSLCNDGDPKWDFWLMLLSVSILLLLVVEGCEGKIGVEGKSSKTQRKCWKNAAEPKVRACTGDTSPTNHQCTQSSGNWALEKGTMSMDLILNASLGGFSSSHAKRWKSWTTQPQTMVLLRRQLRLSINVRVLHRVAKRVSNRVGIFWFNNGFARLWKIALSSLPIHFNWAAFCWALWPVGHPKIHENPEFALALLLQRSSTEIQGF